MENQCKYQNNGSEPGVFYCRNGSVNSHNNLVSLSICKNCPHKNGTPHKIRQELSVAEVDALIEMAKINKQSPPVIEQVSNAMRAITDTITSVTAGNSLFATPETATARWKTCEGCEYRNNNTCSLCGCGLKAKTQIASQACPAGKWEPEIKGAPPPPKQDVPGRPKWAE